MSSTATEVEAGQAVYTRRTLSLYDLIVLGISNRCIWKCPSTRIAELYHRHLSSNHLDVGVGTGYFPDKCRFPTDAPRVAMMDMNPNTLDFASRRISRYHPETYRQNILEPIEQPIKPFDSIATNYLFHCLPGSLPEKSVAFDHLSKLMNPGCRIFGATILHHGVQPNWPARRLMDFYIRKGIFSNSTDSLDDLKASLQQRFHQVEIEVIGCVALFSGVASLQ